MFALEVKRASSFLKNEEAAPNTPRSLLLRQGHKALPLLPPTISCQTRSHPICSSLTTNFSELLFGQRRETGSSPHEEAFSVGAAYFYRES
jgi:hypothetical protein